MIYLESKELEKLKKSFAGHEKKINEAASSGLSRIALIILAKAQQTLKANDNVATGKLINSRKINKQNNLSLDVGFDANYATSIEFGQKAGTIVNINALIQWVKKKGLVSRRGKNREKEAKSIAFAIRESIKQQGTKARPFLYPAMRDSENEVIKVISEAIKRVL